MEVEAFWCVRETRNRREARIVHVKHASRRLFGFMR